MQIKSLSHKDNFFRVMLDAYPAIIFVLDNDFMIVDYNETASKSLNKSGDLILMRTGGDIFNCRFSKDSPKGCGFGEQCKSCMVRQSVVKAFNGEKVERQRARMQIVDDEKVTYFNTLVTTARFDYHDKPYVILTIEDNNNEIEQEEKINRQNHLLQTLIDTIPNPLFYKDRNGKYLGVNKSFEDAMGVKREDIVGKTVFEMYPAELANEYFTKDKDLIDNPGMQYYEYQALFADGKLHDVIYFKSTYCADDGEVEGIIGLMVDISERKKNEIELEKSRQLLMESNRTKDKFISIIAHDLKNPFNFILNATEHLHRNIDSIDKSEIKKEIAEISDSSKQVAQLLENLLQWAKATMGNIQYKPMTFDLYEIAFGVSKLMEKQANQKLIEIENKIEINTLVNADYNMVDTIFRNIVSNAIKFTENGKICIDSKKIEEQLCISICDTGIGMQDELIKDLFSIDRSFSSPGTRNESGSGLGLILTKEFIEINKGRISVKSTVGKGTTFMFSLPIGKD